ncbi:uncharacterized protein [Diadema setosum]|uniref:uncharacterized protein n=1 Tax=Diadema setosum TaxID=31175 RepID=UPI003B3B5963
MHLGKGKRGVAVHRARTSCGRVAVGHDCTSTELGETVGGPSQVSDHRAGDPQHALHAVFERKEPIAWPPARSDKWELFDIKLAGVLKVELAGSVEKKMRMFEGLCYGACAEEFGIKPVGSGGGGNVHSVEGDFGKSGSRRQRLMAQLRAEKKSLRRRWRQADGERASLKGLYEDLKKRYADVRRAEYQCRKRRRRRRERREFYKNPHRFTKRLFEEGVSGSLEVSKEELERHLKATYCDGRREEPFTGVAGLLRPQEPEVSFDLSELKLWEVEAVVKKARAGSAAGQNGLSYKLFKYCPRVRRVLWRILRVLWRERIVPVSWCVAEGVYIPKERDAKGIGQFRPISLLNVDGKILFSVLARRLSAFVMKNKFVDTSIQKAGIPGFPGCTEHVQMIWESIQRCKREKEDVDVIWLDLANAYGSVPHRYLSFALEFFWVPRVIREMVQSYYSQFRMRFTTQTYTTEWQALEIGIPMGCPVSPLLFVLGMEVLTRCVAPRIEGLMLAADVVVPSIRAFMDDLTIVSGNETQVKDGLHRLEELVAWTRMKFKAKKSRSVSVRKGKVVARSFQIGGEDIPQVTEQGVKSLGRWYEGKLNDRHRGVQIYEKVVEWLKRVDRTLIPGNAKVWCCQFGLLPRIMWQLQVYEVAVSRVERMQQKMNSYYRKWLGVPRMLTDLAFFCRSGRLQLPMTSVVEEFKDGKVRLVMMMRESKDQVIAGVRPPIRTGRKWRAEEAADEAVAMAKWKEMQGAVQVGRKGVGFHQGVRWYSKQGRKGRRELVVEAVKEKEEEYRFAKAVQQGVQGAWTRWEGVEQRKVSWNDLWSMSSGAVRFMISSTFDVLPSPVNLQRWGIVEDGGCRVCNRAKGSLEHILSACGGLLQAYTWRHNQVLKEMAEVARVAVEGRKKNGPPRVRGIRFVKEGVRCSVRRKGQRDDGGGILAAGMIGRCGWMRETVQCQRRW